MKTILIGISALLGFASTVDLTGKWETKPSESGVVTAAVFKSDNTYEAYRNNQPFVYGTYNFNAADSTIEIEDEGCSGIKGIYKVNFFSDADSVRFTAIQDDCSNRKTAIESAVLGKVKE